MITSDYENDSTRGLPYQDTVHLALKIMQIHAFGLMNMVVSHSGGGVVNQHMENSICFFVFWFGFPFGNPNPTPRFLTDDDDDKNKMC